MKIIVPYTDLNEWTELLTKTEHPETQFIDVSGSLEDYYHLMVKTWREQETFILMEHDALCWPGALQQLWDCPEPFCMFQTPMTWYLGEWQLHNGPAKFHKSLMERFPTHMDEVNSRDWHNVYYWLYEQLQHPKGIVVHIHTPPVIHLNANRFTNEWNGRYTGTPTHTGRQLNEQNGKQAGTRREGSKDTI